uniref:Uncharacterized protein n=1 Tax=viral metagenome TaxID=1070528 RepID=A0A6H1ZC00_9ZZZZ
MNKDLMNINDKPIPGLENFDPAEDYVISRIKVSGKRGLFDNKVTNMATPKIECVLLTRIKTRTKFKDGFPECKSLDRVSGSLYGKCQDCQYATEKDDKDRLSCQPAYEFLLMLEGSNVPYVMSVSTPSSLGPAKRYISSFLVARKPLFSVKTVLSYVEKKKEDKETGEKFSYYAMTFEAKDEIDKKDQEIYHKILETFKQSGQKVGVDLPEESAEDEIPLDEAGESLPF